MADHPLAEKAELHLSRHYPVAAEKVWRAWTDPQALSQWFGPGDVGSVLAAAIDLRSGGAWRIRFRTQDGEVHEVGGIYQEVEPLRRLVFSWAWHSTPERVSLVTLSLRGVDGGTELDLRHTRFFDEAAATNHRRGWAATLEKLDVWIAS
jgi:uncharacterized protein YndB with AHSA1/START domain